MTRHPIAALSGSLRKRSYNTCALQAAGDLAPASMALEPVAYDDVPIYNPDLQDTGFPASVLRVADQLRRCAGVVIASPEYNHSIAGPLKNLIDWLSRLPAPPFRNKPLALLSVTAGPLGGARHQHEVRKILGSQEALVMHKPEIYIGQCASKFDATGALVDEPTRQLLAQQMLAFEAWIARMAA